LKKKELNRLGWLNSLAKAITWLNGYVQNRQQPRLEILFEIANILEIDVKELLKSNKEN
jgi:putative transcriptional regulator